MHAYNCTTGAHVTVGGQLAGVSLLLPPCVLGIQLSVAAQLEANIYLPTISQVCLCMFTATSNTLLQPQTTLHFAVHAGLPLLPAASLASRPL